MTETTEKVEHPSLAAALAAFQAEVPSVRKGNQAVVKTRGRDGGQGGEYKYDYADLTDVTEKVLPALGRQGLSWSCRPTMSITQEGSAFVLEYALRHGPSGEADEGIYPLPDPTKSTPQELGGALTYARRYLLCAVTGVAPGGDDDDAHESEAQGKPASSPPRQQRAPRQDPRRSTPDEPLAAPKATKDWSGLAAQADTYEQLKAVHEDADKLGELGLPVSGDGETVAQMLLRRRGFLKAQAEKAAPVVQRDFVSEARAVTSRALLQALVTEAADAGVPTEVLQQMAQFEEGLPADVVSTGDGWYKPAEGPLAGDTDD